MKEVFKELRSIMLPMTESLDVTHDEPGRIDVYTFHVMKNGKPLWFGGVQIKKNYVSYHLMPVYSNPALLKGMSAELKKRMQGKSCFNFKVLDKALFAELSILTKSGYDDYVANGFVSES